jgi:hypothetical protein
MNIFHLHYFYLSTHRKTGIPTINGQIPVYKAFCILKTLNMVADALSGCFTVTHFLQATLSSSSYTWDGLPQSTYGGTLQKVPTWPPVFGHTWSLQSGACTNRPFR